MRSDECIRHDAPLALARRGASRDDCAMAPIERLKALTRAAGAGYAAAVTLPLAITYGVTWLNLPAFFFERVIVLLVIAVAIPWGFGPAVVASVLSVVSHNVLLEETVGRPAVRGYQ